MAQVKASFLCAILEGIFGGKILSRGLLGMSPNLLQIDFFVLVFHES